MFLVQIPDKKSGRAFLQISEDMRVGKKNIQREVPAPGYPDELEKQYSDPLAHFTEAARHMMLDR